MIDKRIKTFAAILFALNAWAQLSSDACLGEAPKPTKKKEL